MKQSNISKKVKEALDQAREVTKQSEIVLSSSESFERTVRSRNVDQQLQKSLRELRKITRGARRLSSSKG